MQAKTDKEFLTQDEFNNLFRDILTIPNESKPPVYTYIEKTEYRRKVHYHAARPARRWK